MSEMDEAPRRAEPTSTVLARIEGAVKIVDLKVDGIGSRMASAEARLDKHDTAFGSIRLAMQQLALEAKARADSEAAAVAAVKKSREDEAAADERRWTPKARMWTTLAGVAAVLSAAWAIYTTVNPH